jgi:hypothetical protein
LPGGGQGACSFYKSGHTQKFVLPVKQVQKGGIFSIHIPELILIIGYFGADIRHKNGSPFMILFIR